MSHRGKLWVYLILNWKRWNVCLITEIQLNLHFIFYKQSDIPRELNFIQFKIIVILSTICRKYINVCIWFIDKRGIEGCIHHLAEFQCNETLLIDGNNFPINHWFSLIFFPIYFNFDMILNQLFFYSRIFYL